MHYELLGNVPIPSGGGGPFTTDPAALRESLNISASGTISAVAVPKYPGPMVPYSTEIAEMVRQPMPMPKEVYVGYTGTVEDLRLEMQAIIAEGDTERMPYIAQMLRRKADDEKRANVAIEMMIWADRLDAAAKEKAQGDPNRTAATPEPQAAPVKQSTNFLPMAIAGAVAVMALQ
jgi:hypothetical protein